MLKMSPLHSSKLVSVFWPQQVYLFHIWFDQVHPVYGGLHEYNSSFRFLHKEAQGFNLETLKATMYDLSVCLQTHCLKH
jgi:hypothetical protein